MQQITLEQLRPTLKYPIKSSKWGRHFLRVAKVDEKGIMVKNYNSTTLIKNNYNLKEGFYDLLTLGESNLSFNFDENDYPFSKTELDTNYTYETNLKELDRFIKVSSSDITRLYLCGLAITPNGVVSCDGHQMIYKKVKSSLDRGIIMPNDGLEIVIKLLKKYKVKENFKIEFDNTHYKIENDHFLFVGKLIERDYPNWEAVIPNKTIGEFEITNLPKFTEIEKSLDKNNRVNIYSENEKLFLKSILLEKPILIGNTKDKIDLNLNYKFLRNIFGKNKTLKFKTAGKLKPIITEMENSLVGIIMPFTK